jgi:predicted PurR-regulated permease PerM
VTTSAIGTVAERAAGEAPLPAEELEERPTIVALAPDAPATKVDSRGTAIVTLAVLATLFAMKAAADFVVPVIVGILLAYALDPMVSWLARWRIPRWLGSLVVLGSLVAACMFSVYALRHQAKSIVDQLPTVVTKVQRAIDVFDSGDSGLGIDRLRRAADALQKASDQATGNGPAAKGTVVVVQDQGNRVKDYFLSGSRNILAMAGQLVMVVFLAFFILVSGDQFRRKFVKVAGRTLSAKKITVQMFDAINLSIQRFMAMLLVANVVLAIVTWGVFRMLGLENAGTWGVVAGVLHIVPYFGPVLVAGATGVAALVQFGSIGQALVVAGSSLVVATLVGVVLTTWMAGRIARMNTVSIFVGLLLFGWLWGVWGVLLSVPIVVIVKVVSDHVEGLKALSEFLGD